MEWKGGQKKGGREERSEASKRGREGVLLENIRGKKFEKEGV